MIMLLILFNTNVSGPARFNSDSSIQAGLIPDNLGLSGLLEKLCYHSSGFHVIAFLTKTL